jgi:aminoglycoside phosphotransferase family enzyme/predicted kinase
MTTDKSPEPYAAVAETHTAVVFFVGDRAYKLKKPVVFGFLDFRSRDVREAVCRREVELNRRLAPDVYLGVVRLTCGSNPDGLDEPLVAMRRLPADRRLARLVATGADVRDDLRRLAHLLAAFHAGADTSAEVAAVASRDATASRWEANAAEMAPFVGPILDPVVGERVIRLARRYLAGRGPLFAARIRRGRVKDGHGDLLAEDIFCMPDGPRVLDCIEFDDRLRWGDVLADVAFLAMDLERLGRPDLAAAFLASYREFAAESWPESLAHHYVAYRAQVRAKVACLRAAQGDAPSVGAANDPMALALAHLEAGRVRLTLVGGLPGAGKSTLAAGVGDALGAVVIRSDEVRKQRAGVDVNDRRPAALDAGLYAPQATADVYAELLAEARTCLANGQSVVLDASWRDPSWRAAARAVAAQAVADLAELRCVAPRDTIEARVRLRAAVGGDASDATVAVARAMAEAEEPWPEAIAIDTRPSRDEVLRSALYRLSPRLPEPSSRGHEDHGRGRLLQGPEGHAAELQ